MAFQEMIIAPVGANSLTHAVPEVYQELKSVVKEKYGSSGKHIPVQYHGPV